MMKQEAGFHQRRTYPIIHDAVDLDSVNYFDIRRKRGYSDTNLAKRCGRCVNRRAYYAPINQR